MANDTIEVACLGTGGRCRTLMKSLAQVPGVRIAAVCDIYDPHLNEGKKLADPKAVATKHYRELLDRKDIDAVLIGSPDHWHVPMAVDACNAGKDVYVEKPLTHDLAEGAAIVDAQNRNQRVVQVGMQQRSMPHIQKARELMKAGRIGEVFKVHLSWNRGGTTRFRRTPMGVDPKQVAWKDFLGSAPDQPFDEFRFRNWRWFWDFGGGLLTDLMVHWIDVAHWFLDVDHPILRHHDRRSLRQPGRLADPRHDPVHPGIPQQGPGPLRGDVLQRDHRRDDRVHGHRRDHLHRSRAGTS